MYVFGALHYYQVVMIQALSLSSKKHQQFANSLRQVRITDTDINYQGILQSLLNSHETCILSYA